MASLYDVEVTISSARDLKNVNWRHGELKPYAVVWIDPAFKCSTKAGVDGGSDPNWEEKLVVPLGDRSIEDAVLSIDVVHAGAAEDVKPLVGSARLPLREVVDEAGIGGKVSRSLKLKRPSGRPHGRIEVNVAVKKPPRSYNPYPPPYGAGVSRDYPGSYGYDQPYAAPPSAGYPAPPTSGYPYAAPPTGYPYGAGSLPPQPMGAYGQSGYGQPGYAAPIDQKKKSKMGMGTGLAVGAAAGLLGGLVIAEGVDHMEDKIAENAAERVENDLAYGGNDDYCDDYCDDF